MLTRRNFLHTTTLGALGLSLPRLLQLDARAQATGGRRPKSLIFLFLYGGPGQSDTFDMKPEAPLEYRGEFSPIATSVPGTHICEHLPRMARFAHHYTILRTLHHTNRNHQPAGCWMLTGVNPQSDNTAQLRPRSDDPPALGSLVSRVSPVTQSRVPPFVMLPARLMDQSTYFRGQTGGWLGAAADPLLITQDPAEPDFRLEAFEQQDDVPAARFAGRRDLLRDLDRTPLTREPAAQQLGEFQQRAFDLIAGSSGRSAFDLGQEPDRIRDRYGRNTFGQSCLLARRLIEAGARVVTVSDCTQDGAHHWDTHTNNFGQLRKTLLPKLDLAYTALLEDLLQRGLLEDTVVWCGGEFGRTPRVGQVFSTAGATANGRDHWPYCFSGLLAGGLTRPGMVHGTSDSRAGQPTADAVSVEDLAATLFAAMGLDPHAMVATRDNRPMPVTHGRPVTAVVRG